MRTAGDLMIMAVPRAAANQTVGDAVESLRSSAWAEIGHVYLVDEQSQLIGQVPTERLLCADPAGKLVDLQGDPPIEVRPDDNAERVALLAVERHEADVAVVDSHRRLVGAIPMGPLLALLHEEHVDNFLRMGGIGSVHPEPTGGLDTIAAFRARIPWLVIGLTGGFLAGGVAAMFETALKQEIALAFFLPLVVYMADAVGTQTETILVRSLAYGKVSLASQLFREGAVGLLLGGAIGLITGVVFLLVDGRTGIAIVVAVTLSVTAVVATLVASILPLGLARLGADPALASGPVATVLQDILSVAIYLSIATIFLCW
jgi:magnesium transporter